jgi:GNAT superfamily N-acetyltransferase
MKAGLEIVPTIDVTRTYLEMRSPAELLPAPAPAVAFRLERVDRCPADFFRFLYREVGREWHWRDRLGWTDDEIRGYLAGPVHLWVLRIGGSPAGYFELRRHEDGSIEIAYFGLLPGFLGAGVGKYLLTRAIEAAWALGTDRVWLHTCTLDHPAALPNYLKRGFRPVRTEVYQADIS